MIKILRFITRMNIGGPAIHVGILDRELDQDEFHCTLARGNLSPNEGSMEHRVDRWKPYYVVDGLQREVNLIKDIKAFRHILYIIKYEKPDIVHTHTAKAGMLARTATIVYNLFHSKKIKIVHTYHGNVFSGYFGKTKTFIFLTIERILARFTDVIIAISPSQKEELDKLNIKAKIELMREVTRLGFNLCPFLHSKVKKNKFRTLYNLGDAYLVGIVGRLTPIKNHKRFLDIAKRIIEDEVCFDIEPCKFVIIGDGELRQELFNYCLELGIEKRVVFCGWVEDMPMVYADLDLLLLTSDNEGTPVSIIEAMASGTIVFSTDVGGVKDLLPKLDYNWYGLTRGTKNVDESKKFVIENYNKERLIKDIENLYRRIT